MCAIRAYICVRSIVETLHLPSVIVDVCNLGRRFVLTPVTLLVYQNMIPFGGSLPTNFLSDFLVGVVSSSSSSSS